MKYIIGNWKANKNSSEVADWFETCAKLYKQDRGNKSNKLGIIICPSFVHLAQAKQLIQSHNLPFRLGAQDVSPFNNGPYTGEVTASQLKEFVEYVVIGHSERRNNFKEDDKLLAHKVTMVVKMGLRPIYCVQNEKTYIPTGIFIVAYEPVWAIGTGSPETPKNANQITGMIKQKNLVNLVVYGGSVTPENATQFLLTSHIDGVLVGGVSLDPAKFWQIIVNASSL